MTVRQLIKKLQGMNPNMDVVLRNQELGDSTDPVETVEVCLDGVRHGPEGKEREVVVIA